jgi:pantoate--beta-alanine ligase
MTRVLTSVLDYRKACSELSGGGKRLALVPTLGALHHAHGALMRAARDHADHVIVSVFVNPTQFGPNEDFERYPRDLEADVELCAEAGVDLVFAPERQEMYPPGEATRVNVRGLTDVLCGPRRPGHFEGVATVVTKLFAATGPCAAVFGRKDFQQLQVIRRLVIDLLLPVQIVDHPTLRDRDGLATSSRNRYLSPEDRQRALALPRALSRVAQLFAAGERDAAQLEHTLLADLSGASLELEYATIAGIADLATVGHGRVESGAAGAFIAARVGSTRLIDNVILGLDAPPLSGSV